MNKRFVILAIIVALLLPQMASAEDMMIKLYLLPIEENTLGDTTFRGPKYLKWGYDPDPPGIPTGGYALMDYGFTPYALVLAKNITQTDHDALILNSDVFAFPDNLDQPVTDPGIDPFFEAINIPTDWLTPATTYRELLRQTAGMFQFNQRYSGIAAQQTGEPHSIFDTATLDTRLRQMTDQEQLWFLATADSFGYDSSQINDNNQLRLLVKQAGDYWIDQIFTMGGFEF